MLKEIWDFIKNNKWYVLLVMGLLGLYFYQFHGGLSSESEKWDHFGSYVGGIFSAVTLLSVLHGMQLERKRFNEQRIEFENEKKEQEEWRKKEDFERTFFMMLEQHNIKLRELERISKDGFSLVDKIYNSVIFKSDFHSIRRDLNKNDRFYSEIDSYFLNLYRILKFIYKNRSFNVDNEYSSLLRSFLSRKILIILAYHLCDRGKQYSDYINYINEFSFLEHLDLDDLEFRFISYLTGFNKDELRNNFIEYHKNKSQFYYPDEASPLYLSWNGYDNTRRKSIIIDSILIIFSKKIEKQKINEGDLSVSDSDKRELGINSYIFEGEVLYHEFHPLESKKYWDNIFFHILNNFSEDAFSSEQNDKFKDMKVIYQIFLEDPRNKI
jgi:hypothetical protein